MSNEKLISAETVMQEMAARLRVRQICFGLIALEAGR